MYNGAASTFEVQSWRVPHCLRLSTQSNLVIIWIIIVHVGLYISVTWGFLPQICIALEALLLKLHERTLLIISRMGAHLSKLWPYTENWAKSRGRVLFRNTTVYILYYTLVYPYSIPLVYLYTIFKFGCPDTVHVCQFHHFKWQEFLNKTTVSSSQYLC